MPLMTRRELILAALAASLTSALLGASAAEAGSSSRSSSRSGGLESYRLQDQLRVNRNHHKGRSFQDRQSLYRGDSILRREEKARRLAEPDAPILPDPAEDRSLSGQRPELFGTVGRD